MIGYLITLADVAPSYPDTGSGWDAGTYWSVVVLIGLYLLIQNMFR
jgi:hypothetical protein